jgi:hypothetical protein
VTSGGVSRLPSRCRPDDQILGSKAAGAIPFPRRKMNVFKSLRRHFPAERSPAHALPRNARLKAAFASRRAPPNFQNESFALPGRAFELKKGKKKELKKGKKLLPFPSILCSESRLINRLSATLRLWTLGKIFSRPLLAANRCAPPPDRSVASGARRNSFDGHGRSAAPHYRLTETTLAQGPVFSKTLFLLCSRDIRIRQSVQANAGLARLGTITPVPARRLHALQFGQINFSNGAQRTPLPSRSPANSPTRKYTDKASSATAPRHRCRLAAPVAGLRYRMRGAPS